MADLPKRFVGLQIPNTATTAYTVPASTTSIVRAIHVANNQTATNYSFSLSIGTLAVGTQLFTNVGVAAACTFDWQGFLPLVAGEIIQVIANTAGQLTITICGVEVS